MLIILNGSEAINKTYLAKMILSAFLSPFDVEGYKVKFKGNFYEIYDSNNELVFRPSGHGQEHCNKIFLDEGGFPNQEGISIQDQAEAHAVMLFRDGIGFENYLDSFIELHTDFGVWTGEGEEWKSVATNQNLYQKLINSHNNSPYGVFVATGSFSKSIVSKLKQDLGSNNVVVVNITRNPSISFCLHQRTPDYYTNNINASEVKEFQKIHEVTMNTYVIHKMSDVVNIHYEDIIKNKSFVLLNKTVEVDGIEDYNGLITVYEKEFLDNHPIDNHKFTLPEKPDFYPNSFIVDLAGWNTMNSNFHSAMAPGSPFNVFQELGYTTLTKEQIMKQ